MDEDVSIRVRIPVYKVARTRIKRRVATIWAGAKVTWADLEYLKRVGDLDEHCPSVFTDADGRFALAGIPSQKSYLVIDHADWPTHIEGPIGMDVAEVEKQMLIYLDPGVSLSGEVFGSDSRALQGVRITANPQRVDVHLRTKFTANTGSDGRFKMDGLPVGEYMIRAEGKEGAVWWTLYEVVNKQVGPEGLDLAIRQDSDCLILGTVNSVDVLPKVFSVVAQRLNENRSRSGVS